VTTPTNESDTAKLLDWDVGGSPFPGQSVSGDMHLVQPFATGVLVAAVDGLGHGVEAAAAAQLAVATLQAHANESVLHLVKRCHEVLRGTRGAVLSLASFCPFDDTMTWIGVGNVEGVLLRPDEQLGFIRDYVILHGGVVGLQLPPLRAFVIPVQPGDTLVFVTDGIRSGFSEGLPAQASPQDLTRHIITRDFKGTDDALVLAARYQGGAP
jgi:phosphoserine phosphatase RsbX